MLKIILYASIVLLVHAEESTTLQSEKPLDVPVEKAV